jgi:OOP family OmpA-OmpF porin
VTVREFVNWLSFNASPAPSWGRKGPADQTVTLFHLFHDESAELTPEAVPILSAYRKALREHSPRPKVKIMVHTDVPGTAEANQGLSEQRAQILRQFFTSGEEGVEHTHLIVEGCGNTHLLTDDVKKRGRINNRIELIRLR